MSRPEGFAEIDSEFVGAVINRASVLTNLKYFTHTVPQKILAVHRAPIGAISTALLVQGGKNASPHTRFLPASRKVIGAHLGFMLLDTLSNRWVHTKLGLTDHPNRPSEEICSQARQQFEVENEGDMSVHAHNLAASHVMGSAVKPSKVVIDIFPGIGTALSLANACVNTEYPGSHQEVADMAIGAQIAVGSFALDLKDREARG